MEAAAAAAAAARGSSLSIPSSHSSRKEWRVVSEASVRNSGNEDLERSKLGQSDERLIFEVQQGGSREPADVDFCSITIDGSLDNDILQQRLHSVVKQREELQQIETDLRAQLIARVEIMEMRNTYDAQIKDHANVNIKLQEQLREKEQRVLELERKIDEKDRELHAIRLDNEAAWAKEDLLREQSKELQTYRRERDNSEAERAQHIKQIHDLQEHFQEKEQQLMELQEQNRIAQETILYKDEQLREAQSWITRVQEMDALQSTTNQTLQAELRERTEQYNQLWLGCQRQFGEMERLHMHIQQLQLELAEARERNTYSDKSHISPPNTKDVSQMGQSNGGQLEISGSSSTDGSFGLPNGNGDNASFVSVGNASVQVDHAQGVPIAGSSLLPMPTYLPHGQVTALHPYVMHQQGVPHSLPSHIGPFHSVPAVSSVQQWQNQQVLSEGPSMATNDQHPPLQSEATMLRSDTSYGYESSVNGHVLHSDYMNANISQGLEPHSAVSTPDVEGRVLESMDKGYLSEAHSQRSLQQISSQFHEALRLDNLEHNNDLKDKNVNSLPHPPAEAQGVSLEKTGSVSNVSSPEEGNNTATFSENASDSASDVVLTESFSSTGQKTIGMVGKSLEANLLDERSLLACIVRTIPPGSGGKIRISSTLPNRLGKMIAPLHWHDYKRKYGKLDEFVASHPELFVIEGDFIQLREGAQEIIAATAAVAKVAAAAAAGPSAYSSLLPSVAVTPMAQTHRLKKPSSIESSSGKSDGSVFKDYAPSRSQNLGDNLSQLSATQNQRPNGVSLSNSAVKILSKPKDQLEVNGLDGKPGQAVLLSFGNGTSTEKNDFRSSQAKGSTNWKANLNVVGKQSGRAS
ncbi:OLC1v1020882C2 [Oldenlandia corymbosa var. corymbosa]|uniref:OLC1v1020882C2 n=1 Tax=Oldenlandia corymbosa var. corymbosa TaxID=529605 RepID=A0AAV1BY38_OLDCO|nr:OLC1v1020882C2 [Oldenlandia corymbosa var. corymbosa]